MQIAFATHSLLLLSSSLRRLTCGLQLNSAVYDGLGHYYNLNNIHKSKYYKGVGGNVNEKDKHFYQKELSPLLDKLLGKMIAEKDGKFEYKVNY